jgi:hypothetical protein
MINHKEAQETQDVKIRFSTATVWFLPEPFVPPVAEHVRRLES